jgi:antitoxin MazE
MEAVIRKWGNSPALRLPSALLKEAGYRLDQTVELVVADGRIIIQPAGRVEYRLDDLVSGISEANAHGEVDVGPPQGRETL